VRYVGLEPNPAYIENAKQYCGVQGTIICSPITEGAAPLDAVYAKSQSLIGRFFAFSGPRQIRSFAAEYQRLSQESFTSISIHVANDLIARVRCTHLNLECSK
jgi:hypothetical protein